MDLNIFEVSVIWNDINNTVQFFQNKNILKRHHVCCGQNIGLVKSKSKDGREFKCHRCKNRYSLRTGSFFYDSKLPLTVLLAIIYFFSVGLSAKDTYKMIKDRVTKKSIIQWFVYLRDICTRALLQNGTQLGGIGQIVEIDECCIGRKRKFNRGYHRGGGNKWIFGILDLTTKKCHIQYVPDRTRETLFTIIRRLIVPGTTIHSDEAQVYVTLNQEGFIHKTVCHEENYVNPIDGTTTNHIENFWSHLKNYVHRLYGINSENLPLHLDEYMYKWNRKSDGPFFYILLADISHFYPV